jgi:hypothetical protein
MRAVESQWWIIELPDEWEAEQDDETILISECDGVGEIAITTLQKESGEVFEEELLDFTAEIEAQYGKGISIELAEFEGFYFTYSDEGDSVREWYLRCDDLLLFITYSCDQENSGMDDSAVDEILSTIFIKSKEQVESESN